MQQHRLPRAEQVGTDRNVEGETFFGVVKKDRIFQGDPRWLEGNYYQVSTGNFSSSESWSPFVSRLETQKKNTELQSSW